jgi:S-adenosylmethionine:tRNA ribosyltransferase-isomerase
LIEEFDFSLPKGLIAQRPARPRDKSRLLVIKGKNLEHLQFKYVTGYFKPGDVLVINDSKVLPNKLSGKKVSGSPAQIIVCESDGKNCRAQVICKNPHVGTMLDFHGHLAEITGQEDDVFWLRFDGPVERILKKHGELPQPQYVKELKRRDHYQTIYAKQEGSLAAPTSGLHFTPKVLQSLKKKGVLIVKVTLHISFGTFRPIRTKVEDHKMDPETYIISKAAADTINNRKGRLVVCGTTVFKALESSAEAGRIKPGKASSSLFIYPGHKFKVRPDMMITNFHFPKSTLILFVAAYFGRDIVMHAYEEAVRRKYRFYSLGDACLFITENSQPQ